MGRAVGGSVLVGIAALGLGLFRNWEILFSGVVPDGTWVNYAPESMTKCPPVDEAEFRNQLLRVPEVSVESHFDCVRHGRAFNRPILCTGLNVPPSFAQDIIADPSEYTLQCYNLSAPPPGRSLVSTVMQSRCTYFNGTLAEVMERPECYAGFIYGDHHQDILRRAFPHLDKNSPGAASKAQGGDVHFGTSFLSNFASNQISAADHAALIESVVYQLAGRKIFLLHNRHRSTHPFVMTGSFVPYPSCAKDYWGTTPELWAAVVKPGSILYFPFSWQHTVFTEKGLNVMTNIRVTSKSHVVSSLSIKELMAFGLRILFKGRPKPNNNPRFWDVKKEFFFKHNEMHDDVASTEIIKSVLEELL